ncbi:Tad domain-containing protein [Bacillus sp. PS06]|uniref:Tad domain-containing protein n=1 Tax=Bacillus sp. PS06 TaxID=2764176 RepID=UPI0017837557|nr:TadE/TadG family type IV pilus assembly protein [Bacillus sp. PS06]MBD8069124.1 hypothetical protein [Bacillus sp. PS06]
MKRLLKNENGQVIILVTLWLTIFLACTALVVDVGSLYLEKSRLQNIVDASTLAGAQELPANFIKAQAEAVNTIIANNGNPNNFSIETNTTHTMIEVRGRITGTLFFATALGIDEPIIEASARVELQPLTAVTGAIPLGILHSTTMNFGTKVALKVSDSANGNFGAIALTGPGAKNYETDLTYGYGAQLYVGELLNTETGKMANPTVNAISKRISDCPNATYLNYSQGCSRVVIVPIYVPVQGTSQKIDQVRIVGFGTFFIDHVTSTSVGAAVEGYFIRSNHSGDSAPGQHDYGTYSYKLTR